MIQIIENAMVARLSEINNGWTASPLTSPDDIDRPMRTPQIFVVFRREQLSTPAMPNSESTITQEVELQFDVLLKSPDLRSDSGLYWAIGVVRERLTGFVPIDGSKGMYQLSAQMISAGQGVWLYGLNYGCKLVYQKRRF